MIGITTYQLTTYNFMKKIYTFLGLPASGKGTHAEEFANNRGLVLIGIGDLIREEIEKDPSSHIVQQIEDRYDKGIPQKDDVIFWLIKNKLKDVNKGVVFDNFPFSESQHDFIEDLVKEKGWSGPTIIYIKISPETSLKRISSRKICPECKEIFKDDETRCPRCNVPLEVRADDNVETVKKRIAYYEPRIKQILDIYSKKNQVVEIDGEPSIPKVAKQIETIK